MCALHVAELGSVPEFHMIPQVHQEWYPNIESGVSLEYSGCASFHTQYFFYFISFGGTHPVPLRDYSFLCSQKYLLEGLGIWDAKDQIQVRHMKGKCPILLSPGLDHLKSFWPQYF